MVHSNTSCLPAQDNFIFIDDTSRTLLSVLFLFFLVAGVTVNSFAAYLTFKTKQWKNRSLRLMGLLCICDTGGSIFVNITYFCFLRYYNELSCTTKIIFNLSAQLFSHSSAYMVCLIGNDRYIRVLYLNDYEVKFTAIKYYITLGIYLQISILQTLFTFIGPYYIGPGYGALLTTPLNVLIGVVTLICYILSIKKLHVYNKQSRSVSNSDRSLVKLASLHLFILLCCYTPVIIYGLTYKLLNLSKESIAIFTACLFSLNSIHAITNATFFIIKNRANKAKAMYIFRSVFQPSKVDTIAGSV